METKDYLLFFGPLAGIILGGFITSGAKWLELRHLRKVELKNARLTRLESIHLMLTNQVSSTKTYSAGIIGLCVSHVSNQERMTGLTPVVYDFQQPIEAIASQIMLHINRLTPEATEAVRLTTEASDCGRAMVNLHLTKTVNASERDLAFDKLRKSLLTLQTVVMKMEEEVAKEVRTLLST